MAFKEKSAWLMLIATLVVGLYMTYAVVKTYMELQQVPASNSSKNSLSDLVDINFSFHY